MSGKTFCRHSTCPGVCRMPGVRTKCIKMAALAAGYKKEIYAAFENNDMLVITKSILAIKIYIYICVYLYILHGGVGRLI